MSKKYDIGKTRRVTTGQLYHIRLVLAYKQMRTFYNFIVWVNQRVIVPLCQINTVHFSSNESNQLNALFQRLKLAEEVCSALVEYLKLSLLALQKCLEKENDSTTQDAAFAKQRRLERSLIYYALNGIHGSDFVGERQNGLKLDTAQNMDHQMGWRLTFEELLRANQKTHSYLGMFQVEFLTISYFQ